MLGFLGIISIVAFVLEGAMFLYLYRVARHHHHLFKLLEVYLQGKDKIYLLCDDSNPCGQCRMIKTCGHQKPGRVGKGVV